MSSNKKDWKWSKDDIKLLIEMRIKGKSADDVAKLLGRSKMAVQIKLCTYGLSNSNRETTKETILLKEKIRKMWLFDNKTPLQIAEALDIYQLKVYDLLRVIQVESELSGVKLDPSKRIIQSDITDEAEDGEIVYMDKQLTEVESDPHELIATYSKLKHLVDQVDTEQAEVTLTINTVAEWALVVMSGDYHLGSRRTDPLKIEEDLTLIANTPNAYYAFVGDATDNFIAATPMGGAMEQIMSPGIARKIFAALIKTVKNKLLFMTTGCHDLWSQDRDDYNMVQDIAKETGCAYLGYGGKAHIIFNSSVVYDITAWHKLPGNSVYNIFHPCKIFLQRKDMNNDIVACAHNHISGIASEDFQNRQRVFIRTGAYKSADNFIRKIGYKSITDDEHENIVPCVILNTKTKEMRIAKSIRAGVDLLSSLNEVKKEI